MAGIGFSLRKMMKEDDNYGTKVRAWFHMKELVAFFINTIAINTY